MIMQKMLIFITATFEPSWTLSSLVSYQQFNFHKKTTLSSSSSSKKLLNVCSWKQINKSHCYIWGLPYARQCLTIECVAYSSCSQYWLKILILIFSWRKFVIPKIFLEWIAYDKIIIQAIFFCKISLLYVIKYFICYLLPYGQLFWCSMKWS